MTDTYYTRTLRLVIYPFGENKKDERKRFYQIANDAWKAANWIVTGQYLNEHFIRRLYDRRKIDVKDMKAVAAIEKEFFDKTGLFGSKRQATTDRDHRIKFPNIPPCVSNALNQVVFTTLNKEKADVAMGKRSLRSYRQGMPFTTSKASVEFFEDGDKHGVLWKLSREERIAFYIYYGRDKANNRASITKILNNELNYSAPQFQVKKGKLYLLLPVQDAQKELVLDPELSVGVDLGVSVPAYVAVSKGEAREAIGNVADFLKVRLQLQRRIRNLQGSLTLISGGHGRKKKLAALRRFRNKERNFAKSYNHKISRHIVDFALKHKAGVIKLEFLKGFGEGRENNFILRNWSFFELQDMITYKAKRFGIKVVKVDPYHTSQICSVCGNYEQGQRNGRSFVCKKCGNSINADYNAAVNIARSTSIVKKEGECQYYKLKKAA